MPPNRFGATCPPSRRNPFEWRGGLFDDCIYPAPGGWDALTDIRPVPGVHRPLGVTGIETPYSAQVIEASVIPVRAPSQSEARKISERDGTRPQIRACHLGNEPRSHAKPLMVKCKI